MYNEIIMAGFGGQGVLLIGKLLTYYKVRLGKLGINVKYGEAVTPGLVEKEHPDTVIIATGSSPIIPKIPGVENPNVVTCIDGFLGKKQIGETVVVIGGGLEGCEMAAWLSQKGKTVTLIEQLPNLVSNIHRANRVMLMDMLEENGVVGTSEGASSRESLAASDHQADEVQSP